MRAAADDHDVVAWPQLGSLRATSAGGGRCHASPSSPSASTPSGPAPSAARRVGDDRPHVLAERPAEQHQEALRRLAQQRAPGVRATDPGRRPPTGSERLAHVDRREAGEDLARRRPAERERAVAAGDVDARAAGALARIAADHERALGASAGTTTRRRARVAVPELELDRRVRRAARACAGARRRPSRRLSRPRPRSATATFQPSRSLEARTGRRGLALHRAARDGDVGGRRRKEREAHERSTAPAGRRTARSRRVARSRRPASEIVTLAPSVAGARRHPGDADHRPSCGERRALVTIPTGVSPSTIDRALRRHVRRRRRRSRRAARLRLALGRLSSAQRPMKRSSLSSLTAHGMPAAYGVRLGVGVLADDDVLLLEAQDALRLEPERPHVAVRQQRVPEVLAVGRGAVDLVAELAGEADPQDQALDPGDAAGPPVEVAERLRRAVEIGQTAASTSRLRGPARFIAARPCVRSTSCASIPHAASHHENHCSTAPAPLEVVVT